MKRRASVRVTALRRGDRMPFSDEAARILGSGVGEVVDITPDGPCHTIVSQSTGGGHRLLVRRHPNIDNVTIEIEVEP